MDIARLTVALYANSAQFSSELQKSQKQSKSWSDNVRKTFDVAAKATAAAAVTSATALALVYNQQAELIDQTAKFADRIGISTEALTQLRYASELTGVGSKNLDMSMQRMTRRINEATKGTGEALPALKELGIDLAAIADKTPDQQLNMVADAMTNVEQQSDRVRLAFKLFDSEGVGMVNMLAGGADGLNAMAAEADGLGITLSRVDAAKVEMANDAMYKMGLGTDALKQQITTQLAPIVAGLAEEFTNYSRQFGGMNNMISDGIHSASTGVGFLADTLHGLNLIYVGLNAGVQAFKTGMVSAAQPIANAMHFVGSTIFKVITSPLLAALKVAGAFSDDIDEMATKLQAYGNQPVKQLYSAAEANQAMLDLNQAMYDLRTLAAEPLPSEGIETWYQENKARFDQLAKDYAKSINLNQEGGTTTENPAVAAFRAGTDQMALEVQRRLAIQAAGDNEAAVKEGFAYQDRLAAQTANFEAAHKAASANKALQLELENEYLETRQLLHQEYEANLTAIEAEQLALRQEQNQGFWASYLESLEENMTNMDTITGDMLNNLTTGFGNAFESMIFDSESLGDAFGKLMEGMARSVVNAIGQMIGQWLAYQVVQMVVGKSTAAAGAMGLASNAAAMSIQAGINAFASTAAIPIVGPAMAPAAMGAAVAITAPMAASVAALAAAGVAGQAHNGISSVPGEGTWLLDKGERVYTNESANKLDQMYGQIMGGTNAGNNRAGSGQSTVSVNLYEDAQRAGQVDQSQGLTGEDVINIFVSNIRQGGEIASTQEQTYNLQRAGY